MAFVSNLVGGGFSEGLHGLLEARLQAIVAAYPPTGEISKLW
jgi:hypothetical protein